MTSVVKVRPGDPGYIATRSINRPKRGSLNLRGRFKLEHWRGGHKLGERQFPNGITTEGKEHMFKVLFRAATQITTWYNGLISAAGYTALASGDTYAEIGGTNGWTEYTDYTDGNNSDSAVTRPEWPETAPTSSGGTTTITNTTVEVFNITVDGTVKGVFTVGGANAQTKGDSTNTGNVLWATALFDEGDLAVVVDDQLKVIYTVDG